MGDRSNIFVGGGADLHVTGIDENYPNLCVRVKWGGF